ncbi:MAG: hypothetical protein PHR35_00555 [Kiritimatiellae bacterium]|nr:hypothetical protein [Kiritimatiellia bacterium]
MSLEISKDPNARATMCRHFPYELVWRPERRYVAGAQIELRSHKLRAFLEWKYVGMEIEGADITFRWRTWQTPGELRLNPNRVLCRAKLHYGIPQGRPLRIRLTAIPPMWSGVDNVISIWTIDVNTDPDPNAPQLDAVKESGSECLLRVKAAAVERLSIYSRPMAGADGKVRTLLVPEDRFGNPSSFTRPVNATLTWMNRRWSQSLESTTVVSLPEPADIGRLQVTIPVEQLSREDNVTNGNRVGDNIVLRGNPVWRNGPDGLRPAFGEFHWHTDFSGDGQRSIHEALRCARDELNMDFAAPSDHNTRGQNWNDTVTAVETFAKEGEFATFFGWENSSDRGHENYYFTDPGHALICGGAAGIVGARVEDCEGKLKALYQTHDFLVIPHHTNTEAETRRIKDDAPVWHPYPWHAPVEHVRMAEIMQIRGNQEQNLYDDVWRGWHQNNQASLQDALARGYKVGFTGGTDNHCGWPGRAYAIQEGTGTLNPKSVILTGLWTEQIERHSIYDSLKARRSWAVWDTRALVVFRINGAISGSEIAVGRTTQIAAYLKVSAEDSLQVVEIVSDGNVVWSAQSVSLDMETTIELPPAEKNTYFYLRALQRDGGIIYASPVFVNVTT